jgi:hypothetical protein
MTKSAARRAIAGGCNARVFSQAAQTKSLNHKPRAGAKHGAGPFIYRNTNAQRIAETKPLDKPPWLTGR